MSVTTGLIARGPWDPAHVEVSWQADPFAPSQSATEAADLALADLRRRSSPSHDGLAARLVGFQAGEDTLKLELQPARWALRLIEDETANTLSVLCLVRRPDGRWLAGRRAEWLATWAGRWALGAGGAVEVDENPAEAMTRELAEEWSVVPERYTIEALVGVPSGMVLLVGMAWLPEGVSVTPDPEHDEYAWWPASTGDWPEEADPPLRMLAGTLSAQE